MGTNQIGHGYYGVILEPESTTQDDRDRTAKVFDRVFSNHRPVIQISVESDPSNQSDGRSQADRRRSSC